MYYFFYFIYSLLLFFQSKETAHYFTVLIISMFETINLTTILDIIKIQNHNFKFEYGYVGSLMYVCFLIANYLIFIRHKRFYKIYKQFHERDNTLQLLLAITYISLSIFIFINVMNQVRDINLQNEIFNHK